MKKLSELAAKYDVNIQVSKVIARNYGTKRVRIVTCNRYFNIFQTHVSENAVECEVAVSLHEGCRDYVDIYAQANLLTAKVIQQISFFTQFANTFYCYKQTILAHGIHLSDKELEVLHQYQTSISHCPNSNCSIRSGMCDVRRLMEKGLRVGLGTGKWFFYGKTPLAFG